MCPVAPCAGQLGDSLQRLAAQRTASLKPAHQYVPWVVVNGIPLLDDDENVSDRAQTRWQADMQADRQADTLTGKQAGMQACT